MTNRNAATSPTVDWYFDFISPFAYFGFHRLNELPEGVEIRLRPVLFAALLDHWGQKGPGEIAPKRLWTFRWCRWVASQQGLRFQPPARHPFNPLPFLRMSLAVDSCSQAVADIFEAIWTTGQDPQDTDFVQGLAAQLDCPADSLSDPAIKQALRQNTEDAIEAGVFGVPTLAIDGTLFWGADAVPLAAAYLREPERIRDEVLLAETALPAKSTHRR